jgi:O-antigen/teichoic acid export membrane protein
VWLTLRNIRKQLNQWRHCLVKLARRFLNAKSGASAIVQTAVANIAVQGLNVVSGVITARALGPGGRGSLAAVIMWPQFLAYALTLGIPVSSIYWLKKRPELSSSLAGASLVLSVVLGILAALVGIVVIPYSLHVYPPETIRFAQIWVVVTPLALVAVTITSQVRSAGSFKHFNLFRFLSPLSVLGVLLVEKVTGHLNAHNAALSYLLAGTPATIWITFWVWKQFTPTLKDLFLSSKLLLGYGVRAWGADLLSTVASQIDRVLVVGMLDPRAMGLYVVAQSAAGVLGVLPSAVAPVTLPRSSGGSNAEILELTGRAVRVTLFVMIAAAIPLLVFGRVLLQLVYGSGFKAAALVLPFLIVEAILDGLTSVLSQAFLAAGFPGTVTILQGCGLVTSIPLLYLLIPRYGLMGAGCALMLATTARFIFILLNFPLKMKSVPPSIFIKREELTVLVRRFRSTSPLPSDT